MTAETFQCENGFELHIVAIFNPYKEPNFSFYFYFPYTCCHLVKLPVSTGFMQTTHLHISVLPEYYAVILYYELNNFKK